MSSSDNSVTSEQLNLLTNEIIPVAVSYLQSSFSVPQQKTPLKIAVTQCLDNPLPPSDLTENGIPDTDFALYIQAKYLPNEEFLAYAIHCDVSPLTGRPTVGFAVINTFFL
jgi:hypothetical protein